MTTINNSLKTLMNLAKVQAVLSKRFDRLSIHGIGFSDFMVLFILHQAAGGKMRRTDLAEKMGMTASGITRMLLPLEKTGLIKREANERDARVSYVALTSTGKRLFEEAKETANALAKEIIPAEKTRHIGPLTDILTYLGGNIS